MRLRQAAPEAAPRQRGRVGVPVTIVFACVLAGCKTDLYTKLPEREANEMLALLLNRGIDASRVANKDGASTIQVEERQVAAAIDLLKGEGLPRQSFKNLGEVFKSSGLVASPTEERARYVYALSEELSRTVSDIDGVLSARVHVVLPKNDLLRQDSTPSSASVFIRHDSHAKLAALLPQIKLLVANSIEGLSYDKVSVIFLPVERAEARPSPAPGAAPFTLSAVSASWIAAVAGLACAGVAVGALGYALLGGRLQRRPARGRELTPFEARPGVSAVEAERKGVIHKAP